MLNKVERSLTSETYRQTRVTNIVGGVYLDISKGPFGHVPL